MRTTPNPASQYYLWPLYKNDRYHADPLEQERTRILFYLFSDVTEKNTDTGAERQRVDLWPLFTWHREFNGNRRLQILALVESALPNNRGVERNWSPLWSLWRSEEQSPGRGDQPVVALEFIPPGHDPDVEKMLAPVRVFPVSIGFGNEKDAFVLHSGAQMACRGGPAGEMNYV